MCESTTTDFSLNNNTISMLLHVKLQNGGDRRGAGSVFIFLIDVPLTFFCPADHVPDWQPRMLLDMVEARSVN